jgi:hypothetical protein
MSGPADDALARAESLQARLDALRAQLDDADPERAVAREVDVRLG